MRKGTDRNYWNSFEYANHLQQIQPSKFYKTETTSNNYSRTGISTDVLQNLKEKVRPKGMTHIFLSLQGTRITGSFNALHPISRVIFWTDELERLNGETVRSTKSFGRPQYEKTVPLVIFVLL